MSLRRSPPPPSPLHLSQRSIMCTGSDAASPPSVMPHLTVETSDSLTTLLDLAANNDLEAFKRTADHDPPAVNEIGLWYGRRSGTNQMVLEPRTPLMVASTYASLDIIRFIVSVSDVDVNFSSGPEKVTALHCAASGGAPMAVEAVKILLLAGANPNCMDGNGLRPADVIVVPPKAAPDAKISLEELLGFGRSHRVSTSTSSSNSPPLSSSPVEDGSPSSFSTSSPMTAKYQDLPAPEKKEYPVDPSLPDIKNSIYATDEFRMFSFKVRPCSRAYSHDWTECPFVHPGENARRRDPRKFHYSCVPCPDFRKGACRRGDLCEYAHGVFECWLHPAQYRTRLCKDGTGCNRRVCFFAHTPEELRPLFVSTGSAVPSPRSAGSGAAAMEMAMSLLPGSPSSMMSPMPFTPPMSPSGNGMSPSSLGWPQPNVPTLHLSGANMQSSRLRSSLNARDIPADEFAMLQDMEGQQLLSELSYGMMNGNGRSKSLAPANLDDLFSAELTSSPRFNSDPQSAVFSPTHKSAVLNQFQQHQSFLSPINTNVMSPNSTEPQQMPAARASFLQASFGIPSPGGRMSPRSMEPLSPISSRLAALAQRERLQQQQLQLRSLSSRELGSGVSAIVGSPVNTSATRWGSPSGKLDWSYNGEDGPARLRRSNSFELGTNGEEPDVSWVHSLVKESPPEIKEKRPTGRGTETSVNGSSQSEDHTVIGAWLEQMNLTV